MYKYRVLCMFIACLGGEAIMTNVADASMNVQENAQLSQQTKQRLIKVLTELETRRNDNTNRYNQWYLSLSTMLNIMIVRCVENGVDAKTAEELDYLSSVLDKILSEEKYDRVAIKACLEIILESVTRLDKEDLKIIQLTAEQALYKAIPDENVGIFFMRLGQRRTIKSLPLPANISTDIHQMFGDITESLRERSISQERYSGWYLSLSNIFEMMVEIVSDNVTNLAPADIETFADMIKEMHGVIKAEKYDRVVVETCLKLIRDVAVCLDGKLKMRNVINMVDYGLQRIPKEDLAAFFINLTKMPTSAMELLKK